MPNDGGPKRLNKDEAEAVENLSQWASELALPSSAFAAAFDEHVEITKGKKNPGYDAQPRSPASASTDHSQRSKRHRGRADSGLYWPCSSFCCCLQKFFQDYQIDP